LRHRAHHDNPAAAEAQRARRDDHPSSRHGDEQTGTATRSTVTDRNSRTPTRPASPLGPYSFEGRASRAPRTLVSECRAVMPSSSPLVWACRETIIADLRRGQQGEVTLLSCKTSLTPSGWSAYPWSGRRPASPAGTCRRVPKDARRRHPHGEDQQRHPTAVLQEREFPHAARRASEPDGVMEWVITLPSTHDVTGDDIA
jgi:hypothetical protein